MSIVGLQACKAALTTLMASAEAAVKAAQGPAAIAAAANDYADRLVAYANQTESGGPAEDSAIQALDTLAIKTSNDLAVIAIGAPVGAIAARSAELAALIATLDHGALANASAADKLKLKPLSDAVSAIADGVASAKAMTKTLDATQPNEASVIATVNELSAKLVALRAALDKLGQG